MSDEYQIFGVSVDYFGADGAAQVSGVGLDVYGLTGAAQIFGTHLEVYIAAGIRIKPVKLSRNPIIRAPLVQRAIVAQSLPASNLTELIPYAKQLPESLNDVSPELHAILQETMGVLREQHDLATTGGSTYPWEFLLRQDVTPKYRVGTTGRFYHPIYGIIHARYIQLTKTVPTDGWFGQPVGYPLSTNQLDWQVTNDFSQSAANNVVGFLATNEPLVNGNYTWVIVEGVNIHSMRLADTVLLEQGKAVVWSGTGLVSQSQPGIVCARMWKGDPTADLQPGLMLIKLESESAEGLVAPVRQQLSLTSTRVADLEASREATDLVLANLDAGIDRIDDSLTTLEGDIDAEQDARRRNVQQLKRDLRDLESRITLAYRAADQKLRIEYLAADNELRALFEGLNAEIDQLESVIESNYAALNQSIIGLRRRIEGLEAIYGVTVPFRLAYTYNGVMLTGQIVDSYVFDADVVIPQNAPTSQLRCKVGPSSTTVIELKRGSSVLGEIQFTASATTGTITWPAEITFAAGDVLDIVTPANLNGLESLFFSLIGSFIR